MNRRDTCPVCGRYFPFGLWTHTEKCVAREVSEHPNGYRDSKEYIESREQERRDA